MRVVKKFLLVIILVALVIGIPVSAFAETNDDVVAALKNANVPNTYLIQAENYLKNNSLTTNQASAVIAKINDASNVLKLARVTDFTKLTTDKKQQVIKDITSAASTANLTITFTKESNGLNAVIVKNQAGRVVANFSSSDVTQTGFNNTAIFLGSILLIVAIGATILMVHIIRWQHIQED